MIYFILGTVLGLYLEWKFEIAKYIIESIKISRQYIHELGYLHNDLSLDNTGYRLSDNKFIVFDFDMVSYDPSRALPKYDVIRGYE